MLQNVYVNKRWLYIGIRAVVVAQLLPTLEIHGSNPVIGKKFDNIKNTKIFLKRDCECSPQLPQI